MTRLLAAIVFLAAAALTIEGYRLRAASADAEAADRDLGALLSEASAIERMRGTGSALAAEPATRNDLLALANAALAEAGIPSERLARVEPQGNAPVRGTLTRQSARLRLEGVALLDLGRLLAAWQAQNVAWVPTAIELTRPTGAAAERRAFHVQLTLSALHGGDGR